MLQKYEGGLGFFLDSERKKNNRKSRGEGEEDRMCRDAGMCLPSPRLKKKNGESCQ